MSEILVVGSVALDAIKTAEEEREEVLGGSATYFSLAAAAFSKIRLVAIVGDDFPKEHVALFQSRGIELSGLERIEGEKTFRWAGVYSDDFLERTTIKTALNVFKDFAPVLSPEAKACEWLFLANIHPAMQLSVLRQMGENLKFVACDTMNLWINTELTEISEVLKKIDLLLINDEETFLLTGETNIHLAAKEILESGPKYLIVKRGEYGAHFYSENARFALPAFPVENVIDPTGAGDTFAGGIVGYLAEQGCVDFERIKAGMVAGTLMAGFTVEGFSAERVATITKAMLKERSKEYFAYTNWPEDIFGE